MSAALALSSIWAEASAPAVWQIAPREERETVSPKPEESVLPKEDRKDGLAFYRKHTERTLRRYLYASMLVGRAPTILREPMGRGWASSRPVRTFEDAVIFVLDIESCLKKLDYLDRQILGKVVLQDYTQEEAACLLGMSSRGMSLRFPQALDRLTRILLDTELIVLPH
jgi:hypothetical protein